MYFTSELSPVHRPIHTFPANYLKREKNFSRNSGSEPQKKLRKQRTEVGVLGREKGVEQIRTSLEDTEFSRWEVQRSLGVRFFLRLHDEDAGEG